MKSKEIDQAIRNLTLPQKKALRTVLLNSDVMPGDWFVIPYAEAVCALAMDRLEDIGLIRIHKTVPKDGLFRVKVMEPVLNLHHEMDLVAPLSRDIREAPKTRKRLTKHTWCEGYYGLMICFELTTGKRLYKLSATVMLPCESHGGHVLEERVKVEVATLKAKGLTRAAIVSALATRVLRGIVEKIEHRRSPDDEDDEAGDSSEDEGPGNLVN